MKRLLLFIVAFVCLFTASACMAQANEPQCSKGTCYGLGVPSGLCYLGGVYTQIDATAGHNLWACTTKNGVSGWTLQTGSGGSSAGSATAGQASDGSGGFVDDGCTTVAGVKTCGAFVTTGPGGGVGQYFNQAEGTIPTTDAGGNNFGGTGFQGCYADATAHTLKCKLNGGSVVTIAMPAGTLSIASGKTLTASNTLTFTGTDSSSVALGAGGTVSYTIASGTSALGTSAISSATCATVVTTTATGTATTDVPLWGFNGDPTGVTGYVPLTAGMLTIIAYPSANNVNFKVCNNTTSSITPGAITLNWRVAR